MLTPERYKSFSTSENLSHYGQVESRFQDIMKGKEEAFEQLLAKTTQIPPVIQEDQGIKRIKHMSNNRLEEESWAWEPEEQNKTTFRATNK